METDVAFWNSFANSLDPQDLAVHKFAVQIAVVKLTALALELVQGLIQLPILGDDARQPLILPVSGEPARCC